MALDAGPVLTAEPMNSVSTFVGIAGSDAIR